MFVLGRVGRQFPRQAFSQATVSHGTVFPPGDFPFLLGLLRSVTENQPNARGQNTVIEIKNAFDG